MLCKCFAGREVVDKEKYVTYAVRKLREHDKKCVCQIMLQNGKKYSSPNGETASWKKFPNEKICAKSIHKFIEHYDLLKYNYIRREGEQI